jgi:hypothetical protein
MSEPYFFLCIYIYVCLCIYIYIYVCMAYETENTAIGIRHAAHAAPLYTQRLALTSLTSGGRSVSIICLRTQAT